MCARVKTSLGELQVASAHRASVTLRLRTSGFEPLARTSGFEPLASNLWLRTSGFEHLASNLWLRTSGFEPLADCDRHYDTLESRPRYLGTRSGFCRGLPLPEWARSADLYRGTSLTLTRSCFCVQLGRRESSGALPAFSLPVAESNTSKLNCSLKLPTPLATTVELGALRLSLTISR